MLEWIPPLSKGFAVSGGLIVAIGAQNAFVLSQGLKRQFQGVIALTCCSVDVLLIFLGVAGMGVMIADMPVLMFLAALTGGLFLAFYAVTALRGVFEDKTLESDKARLKTRGAAIATTLSLTLLNPHVYLDTLVLIGSIGGNHPLPDRWWFAAGAGLASILWFFGLSWGASKLSPFCTRPITWKILDGTICVIMTVLSISLFSMAIGLYPW